MERKRISIKSGWVERREEIDRERERR